MCACMRVPYSMAATPRGRALGRKLSMLGQDDKSHLPTGMNCLVFDDVMYKSPDQRNCLQKTLTSVPSSSRWLLRGVGGCVLVYAHHQ
jgi:hypothetical protein